MAICTCPNSNITGSRRLACTLKSSLKCHRRQRGMQLTVCGSKTRKKQFKDMSDSDQGLREQEDPESVQSDATQGSSKDRLSRSGKPIGWKVLPKEDSPQISAIQEVSMAMIGLSASPSHVCQPWLCKSATCTRQAAHWRCLLCRSNQMRRKVDQLVGAVSLEPVHPHQLSSAALHWCCEQEHLS